jgi:3-oxoacyl-[acyl-carrier-protein] synthase-3
MGASSFNHVKVSGVKTTIPPDYIDIDDELEFFGNNKRKLERQKKMIGYGRRYCVDENTTVVDLAVDAAEKLLAEMNVRRDDIESILFVNQMPDYVAPADACLAHGRLNLRRGIPAMDIRLGCSGYVYGLWTAHSLIASGAVRNCLLLAGDIPTRCSNKLNRKSAPVFSDAASATFLERCAEDRPAHFVMGSDGKGWDKLIKPFGGMRLPYTKDVFDIKVEDAHGNIWTPEQSLMAGEEVFAFTMEVAPSLIKACLREAGWSVADVDLFAIHQANRQILEMIVSKAGIPLDKTPIDVFSKYANSSTNSVVTVLCDQRKESKLGNTVMCTFGIGLSWGGAAIDLSGAYNGGITTYQPSVEPLARERQIELWLHRFSGDHA